MRTKLYVLGAVLGTAPGLWVAGCVPATPPVQSREEERPGEVSRQVGRTSGSREVEALPPAPEPAGLESGAPVHPCELITVMQVPCDSSAATCEYTYWEGPRQVKPLRA